MPSAASTSEHQESPEPWTPEKDGPAEDNASTSSAGLRRLKTTGDDKEVVILLVDSCRGALMTCRYDNRLYFERM